MGEADWVLAVVVEAAARAAAGLRAGAAARAAPEVCGKPANQALHLAAAEPVAVERAQVAEVAMAVVLVAQAVAVDLVEADRAVVEEASVARAEEQVEAGLVVEAELEGEPAVEQAVGAALSVSPGDG